MGVHANAKLGPAGRRELVRLIREGSSERQAAACLSVAPATAHRWSVREREASLRAARVGSLGAGSLEPAAALAAAHRCGHRAARLPGAAAHRLGAAVDRWRDRGCALDRPRHPRPPRPARARQRRPGRRSVATSGRVRAICCTWTSSATRAFGGPVTPSPAIAPARTPTRSPARRRLLSRRRRRSQPSGLRRAARRRARRHRHRVRAARAGVVCPQRHHHTAGDDRRRLELHPQPLARAHCSPTASIRHIVTPPYTPRWNGKVERFHQTMEREWAKGLRYRNHAPPATKRCHTGWRTTTSADPTAPLGGRPPISRAHNLPGQDS